MATARIEIGNITEIEKNGKTIFQRNVLIVRDSGILFYDRLTSRDRASIEIYGTPPEENMTEHTHEMEPTAELILETPTDTIRTMELESLQLTADLAKTHEMAKEIKKKAVVAVENKWEDTQDKSLSNATKRSIAVEGKLAENETYTGLLETTKSIGNKIWELGIEISFQKRQFKREVGSTDDLRLITASLQEIAAAQRSTADNLSLITTRP
jgi:hypothetical protein